MERPFVIIGGQRCATGWLSRCLSEHPEIFVAGDELRLFENNYDINRDWCAAIKEYPGYRGELVFGEKTANYLADPNAANRIYHHVPQMRMIAILRDPVDRMLSQFRLSKKQSGILSLENLLSDEAFWESMITRGQYATHLKRFLTLFPKEQVKAVFYEDMERDPEVFIQDILDFLEVDVTYSPHSTWLRSKPSSIESVKVLSRILARIFLHRRSPFRKFYSEFVPLRKQYIEPEVISMCCDQLTDEMAELEEILGRSLNFWRCNRNGGKQ